MVISKTYPLTLRYKDTTVAVRLLPNGVYESKRLRYTAQVLDGELWAVAATARPKQTRPARQGQPKTPSSGRQHTGKKMVSKRLSADVVAILEQQPDATAYLEAAVRAYHATQ